VTAAELLKLDSPLAGKSLHLSAALRVPGVRNADFRLIPFPQMLAVSAGTVPAQEKEFSQFPLKRPSYLSHLRSHIG